LKPLSSSCTSCPLWFKSAHTAFRPAISRHAVVGTTPGTEAAGGLARLTPCLLSTSLRTHQPARCGHNIRRVHALRRSRRAAVVLRARFWRSSGPRCSKERARYSRGCRARDPCWPRAYSSRLDGTARAIRTRAPSNSLAESRRWWNAAGGSVGRTGVGRPRRSCGRPSTSMRSTRWPSPRGRGPTTYSNASVVTAIKPPCARWRSNGSASYFTAGITRRRCKRWRLSTSAP
jgi:hypothetical protein